MKRKIAVMCDGCAEIYWNNLDGNKADKCPMCGSPAWWSLQYTDESESVNKEIADVCRRRAAADAAIEVRLIRFLERMGSERAKRLIKLWNEDTKEKP